LGSTQLKILRDTLVSEKFLTSRSQNLEVFSEKIIQGKSNATLKVNFSQNKKTA